MARRLLDKKGVRYQEIRVDAEPARRDEMRTRSGRHTVPQVFVDDRHVGGYDDLCALDCAGRLDSLLAAYAKFSLSSRIRMSQPKRAESVSSTEKQVMLQKIYVRDASLEVPNAPEIFTLEWSPKIDVQINTAVQDLAAETHHVLLTVTINARLDERTAYHAEVQQGGLFKLAGSRSDDERRAVLGAYCAERAVSVCARIGWPT